MDSSTDGGDVLTAASFLSLDTEPVVRVLSEPQAAQVLAAIVQKAAEFESLRNQQLYAQLNHGMAQGWWGECWGLICAKNNKHTMPRYGRRIYKVNWMQQRLSWKG